jgi:hypothetical protein
LIRQLTTALKEAVVDKIKIVDQWLKAFDKNEEQRIFPDPPSDKDKKDETKKG